MSPTAVLSAAPPQGPHEAQSIRPRKSALLRRRLRNAVAAIGPLHLALLRRARPEHALHADTELVIDGFPRSANTFLEGCARHAWGEDLRIAQHAHVAAPLRAAVRRGLPAILPLRAPLPAIASLLLRDPETFSPRLALEEYVALHRRVLPALDRLLVVPFDVATEDFSAVATALAERFGPRWRPPERWGPEDRAAAHALVDRLTARRIGRSRVSYSPDRPASERRERDARKARTTEALAKRIRNDRRLSALMAEADALHAACLAASPPALRRRPCGPTTTDRRPAPQAEEAPPVDAPRRPPVAVIGNLPPPVTGAAAVTEAASAHAARHGPVRRLSLSPGQARGALRHPRRALRTLRAAWGLLGLRADGGRHAYLACDGGAGRLYQIALVGLARALGLAVTLHHHSYTYLDRPDATMRALLVAGGPSMRHVFLSPGMRRRFEAAYGAAPSAMILSNAVFVRPPGPTSRRPRLPAEPLRVGLLANLNAAKGLHEMIALAREIARRGVPAEVRLAGPVRDPAERATLEAALADPDLPLRWAGPVFGPAKWAWYAELDLFCLPTAHPDEAQPLVLFEAAFAGAPALAHDRGAIAEQVDRADALLAPGRLFAPWAVEHIATLATDLATLTARAAAARAIAEAEACRGEEAIVRLFDDPTPPI